MLSEKMQRKKAQLNEAKKSSISRKALLWFSRLAFERTCFSIHTLQHESSSRWRKTGKRSSVGEWDEEVSKLGQRGKASMRGAKGRQIESLHQGSICTRTFLRAVRKSDSGIDRSSA